MTRDFNRQRRDDPRPSFRDNSSNNNREERSPHPARTRLNRQTVDRAWESGAQQRHADYHPRTSSGPSTRNGGWRNNSTNQQSGYSSQQSRGGSRPYGNRQDTNGSNYREDYRGGPRHSERPFNDNRGPRPQAFHTDRGNFGNRDFQERDRRSSYDRPNAPGGRQSFRGRDTSYDQNRTDYQGRENPRRDFDRNGENRRDERPSRQFSGGRREEQRENAPHPRWQSRPGFQREYAPRERQEFDRPRHEERFEGDYEHFEDRGTAHRPGERERPGRGNNGHRDRRGSGQTSPPERHVTRLPDGRVLKGPRPAQRKNAEFWTDIAENAEGLVDRVQIADTKTETQAGSQEQADEIQTSEELSTDEAQEQIEGITAPVLDAPSANAEVTTETAAPATVSRRRTRTASASTRDKKAKSAGPRPSQRGYKWPAP